MKPITIYAPGDWSIYDSYGLIACQLAYHLEALGYQVNAIGRGQTVMPNQPAAVQAITSRPIKPSLGGIMLGYPTGYVNHPVLAQLGPRIAVTMFETDRIPSDWADPLNQCQAVIVPSEFLVDVFKGCGVTTPIKVAPLGLGEAYTPRPRASGNRPFRFLAFLDRGKRKGSHWAQFAFMRAFGDDPNVELWLKGRDPKADEDDPRWFKPSNPNFKIIQADLSEQDMAALYVECDALINPNMGEGFGLIPREFAATGGITLTTEWGGTADDLDQWGWGLPYTLEAVGRKFAPSLKGHNLGRWAMPDIDACAATMKAVVREREAFAAEAMRRAANLHNLYSWRAFAQSVADVWEEALEAWSQGKKRIA